MLESSKFDGPISTQHNLILCQQIFDEIFREMSKYISLLYCIIEFNYFQNLLILLPKQKGYISSIGTQCILHCIVYCMTFYIALHCIVYSILHKSLNPNASLLNSLLRCLHRIQAFQFHQVGANRSSLSRRRTRRSRWSATSGAPAKSCVQVCLQFIKLACTAFCGFVFFVVLIWPTCVLN